MEINDKNINLIFRFLTNEISESEITELENWKNIDSKNSEIIESYKKIWNFTSEKIPEDIILIDTNQEWHTFSNNINKTKIYKINKQKTKNFKIIVSTAAIIIILIGLFLIFTHRPQKIISKNNTIDTILPDNSKISINVNTEISFSKNFENNRILTLNGDAYFEVVHNLQKPFIVISGDNCVEVIGTEFYVNTKNNSFQVFVNKGVVKVYNKKQQKDSVILKTGENTIIDQTKSTLTKSTTTNYNHLSWKTRKIEFNNTNLYQITKTLENTYNVKIEISNESLKNLTMTVSFENQSIESILKVIEVTLNIKTTKQGDKIIIYN